jgi:hypothetical protein
LSLMGSFLAEDPGFTGGIFVGAAVPEPSTLVLTGVAIWWLSARRGQYRGCKRH